MSSAACLASNLRARMAALRFDTVSGSMTLTCSFGVSERKPGDSIDDLLKRADVALYAAKDLRAQSRR